VGCAVGIDLGFNACEVQKWIDPETFKARIAFRFGDQVEMRRPRMRVPQEWSLAYDEDSVCIRDSRVVELPETILKGAIDDLRAKLTAQLLEVIPSGPAGIKSNLFELVEQ
jgi:hypothetical protein